MKNERAKRYKAGNVLIGLILVLLFMDWVGFWVAVLFGILMFAIAAAYEVLPEIYKNLDKMLRGKRN